MTSLSDAILTRLRRLRGGDWDESCVAGAPVPDDDACVGADCTAVDLVTLSAGQAGVVSCLRRPASREARKLVALGVLPGVRVELVQRYPAFVIRIGHAELAMDATMASHIRVDRQD